MKKKSYFSGNETYMDQYYPFNEYYLPGKPTNEKPLDLDKFENQNREGEDFEEFDAKKKDDEWEKFKRKVKKIKRKLKKEKPKDVALSPHPFYSSMYGASGIEGPLSGSGLEYYGGGLSEEPGAITNNPYNTVYQSASMKKRREFLSKLAKDPSYDTKEFEYSLGPEDDDYDPDHPMIGMDIPGEPDSIQRHLTEPVPYTEVEIEHNKHKIHSILLVLLMHMNGLIEDAKESTIRPKYSHTLLTKVLNKDLFNYKSDIELLLSNLKERKTEAKMIHYLVRQEMEMLRGEDGKDMEMLELSKLSRLADKSAKLLERTAEGVESSMSRKVRTGREDWAFEDDPDSNNPA
jgi:hypothetical protein